MARIAYNQFNANKPTSVGFVYTVSADELETIDSAKLATSEAYQHQWHNFGLQETDVDGIERTVIDDSKVRLYKLGEGQSLTLRVDYADMSFGPGTIVETFPWTPTFDRIYTVYNPLTRCRYHLTDT